MRRFRPSLAPLVGIASATALLAAGAATAPWPLALRLAGVAVPLLAGGLTVGWMYEDDEPAPEQENQSG